MKRILPFLFLFLLMVAVAPAATLETTYVFDIPTTNTNWTNSSGVAIPQFNVAGGTLQKVTFSLTGTAKGTLRFENMDSEYGSTVDSTLGAVVTLFEPGGTTSIVIATPTFSWMAEALSVYDGDVDYAGTSGKNHSSSTAYTETKSSIYTAASKLAIFTGASTIILPVSAVGSTTVSASGGDVVSNVSTQASAHVSITYTYDVPVPEPGVLATVGGGLIGLGLVFKRRLRKA